MDIKIDANKFTKKIEEKKSIKEDSFKYYIKDFMIIAFVMFCTVIMGMIFYNIGFSEENIVTIFILAVLIISTKVEYEISRVFSSILGVLLFNFFFTLPRFSLAVYDPSYPITFAVMLFSSLIISTLMTRIKNQVKIVEQNAYRTNILFEVSKNLQEAYTLEKIISSALKHIYQLMQADIYLFNIDNDEIKNIEKYSSDGQSTFQEINLRNEDLSLIDSCIKNRRETGTFTDNLSDYDSLYIPLIIKDKVTAVVGIKSTVKQAIDTSELQLLMSMLRQISLAFERYEALEEKQKAELQIENEKFRADLLRAISHDLRTPLTTISGSAYSIMRNDFNPEVQKMLASDIYEDSVWLTNLVENLLSLSKVENENVKLKKNIELAEDLVEEALEHVSRNVEEHKVIIEVEDLLMVEAEASLIIQVIINIVNNAIKYTDAGSEITVAAFEENNYTIFQIKDNGGGISDSDKNNIFDMFFTKGGNKGDERRGLGLGLSLCKTIITVHGGEISVRDNIPKGTIFEFKLPRTGENNEKISINSGR